MSFKAIFLRVAPYWLQDVAISIYNAKLHRMRRAGSYRASREYHARMAEASSEHVQAESRARLNRFLLFAKNKAAWYRAVNGVSLADFPVLEKKMLIEHLDQIATIDAKDAVVSLTGGTTGASMKVFYTYDDTRERFAILDLFRESYGCRLGSKTAWFSGKSLASDKDVQRGRCYRDDLINKIRFFSTFHINQANFESYWSALEAFAPEFIVGFPSSVYEICRVAKERGLKAKHAVRVFFPTAETVLPVHRAVIGEVLGCRLVDQYASSEGAPFILECPEGRLHIQPLTGIFEVVDESLRPSIEGEMLVTSFTTHGTPLIRYRIGDRIALAPSDVRCVCGSSSPIVKWIEGRTSDFIWSPDTGRVNLGNVSNCTKDVAGIVCFQVLQDSESAVHVKVVANERFDSEQRTRFLQEMRLRLGDTMQVTLECVDDIPRERSGKFRIVKNTMPARVADEALVAPDAAP
ncbi:phenylacetate--CoA ligase family protein [Ramlibacter tataouinensis]|uniref:phenylacetate--CoA ligase family protein n=1 Tax=Ramlibacter tataouinensis TaxID=94132 RepID=UPI0022F39643|nr:phenylacetate--CoA ligase family protein [Ramlibacter tataouinensis]WBY02077.1 phenylacetate--CoA ligase family protein [Ramlibacter tataouinensis]